MLHRGRSFLIAFAALALALPLAARSHTPKQSKSTIRASVELSQDATLAGKQLKAGSYQVRADESTLTLLQKGKVVAEAPIVWKDQAGDTWSSSGVMTDSGAVTEVHFVGKKRYAQIAPHGSASTSQGQK